MCRVIACVGPRFQSAKVFSLGVLKFPENMSGSSVNCLEHGFHPELFIVHMNHNTCVSAERHGSLLTASELAHFDGLQDDYEVSWHLKEVGELPLVC